MVDVKVKNRIDKEEGRRRLSPTILDENND